MCVCACTSVRTVQISAKVNVYHLISVCNTHKYGVNKYKPTCTNTDALHICVRTYLHKAFTHTYMYVCYVAYSLGTDSSLFSAIALSINL